MVPTLIATLPMMMVFTIVGMSIAREREVGTFDQLLVSPLQPFEIVIGKAVPGLIVGLVQAVVISLIVTQVFQIKLYGSVFVLFIGMMVLFLIAMIGIALFVSSLVSTQQQGIMCIMVILMPVRPRVR
jgi:ABC-2 type transport system permease protein